MVLLPAGHAVTAQTVTDGARVRLRSRVWAGLSAAHDPADWVAMVTDDRSLRLPIPVFRFSDTAWLVTIANLAWDRAKILPP